MRRKIGQLALEFAECYGGLIEILVRFRRLQANGIGNEIVHAPPAAVFIARIGRAVQRFHQMHRAARIVRARAQIARDCSDILHQRGHVAKYGIVDLLVADLEKRLSDKRIGLRMTDAAKDFIISSAYDPTYGARPLKRFIQSRVETLIARKIIAEDLAPDTVITVDAENGELIAK